MPKITQTKLARALFREGSKGRLRITGYQPAQSRDLIKCPECSRTKLLSVGQIWKCFHGVEK